IRQLRSAGVPVIIKTPLMRSTAPYWKEIEKLAQDLDCEYQMDLSITAKNDGGLSPLAQRVEDDELLKEIYSSKFYNLFLNNEALADNIQISPEAGLCGAGASGLCIEPSGTIRPCIGLNISLGKYPEKSLSDIWHHSSFFKDFGSIKLKDILECAECSNFMYCVRCPGAWHAEHGDFCKPASYTCKLARIWASARKSMKKGGEKDEVESK
ncbi:MAG: SPASM domain-containing protein, partial [Verrucomicrobia bacterium]|nr:SPASM domain-containing protein [Verrucomicrobiota bacterium]